MINILTRRKICCEYCGFEFPFTGFLNADVVACPVCGVEKHAAAAANPPAEPAAPLKIYPEEFSRKHSPAEKSEKISEQPAENTPPCPTEVCPLLTGSETDSTAQKIADKVAERIQIRFRAASGEIHSYIHFRRKKILTRTITVQLTILAAALLFLVKPLLFPKEIVPPDTTPAAETAAALLPANAVPEKLPLPALPALQQPAVLPVPLPALPAASVPAASSTASTSNPAANPAAEPNAAETANVFPLPESLAPESSAPETAASLNPLSPNHPSPNHPSLNPPLPVPIINKEPAENAWNSAWNPAWTSLPEPLPNEPLPNGALHGALPNGTLPNGPLPTAAVPGVPVAHIPIPNGPAVPVPNMSMPNMSMPNMSMPETEPAPVLPPVAAITSAEDTETAAVSPPRALSSGSVPSGSTPSGSVPSGTPPPEPETEITETEKEPPLSLANAEQRLEKAQSLAESDPEASFHEIIGAVKMYRKLEQPLPESLYWLLGKVRTSLSWGEPLTDDSPAVTAMTLSDDNRWLLVQLKDKTVRLWDLKTAVNNNAVNNNAVNNNADETEHKRGSYLLDSGTEYVKFIFTPDLRWIFGGQSNGTIRIWDMSLKNPAESVVTLTERVPGLQDLQLSPNGQWLAAFGNVPSALPLAEHRLLESRLPGSPLSGVHQTAYQHSRIPVKLSAETPVYPVLLWNIRQMEDGMLPAAVPLTADQPAQVIRFSPASEYLAVGRKDATAAVYPLTVKKDRAAANRADTNYAGVMNSGVILLRGHQLAVTQLVFAPDSTWIATGSRDNTIGLWDLTGHLTENLTENLTGTKKMPEPVMLHGHLGWISTLAVDKAGEYLYSGSYDRTIRVWRLGQNRIASALDSALDHEPAVLELNTGVPESLSLTSDGGKLTVMSHDGSLGIYPVASLLLPEDRQSVIFRNSKLSIRKSIITSDGSLLIFSYDNLTDPMRSGIRLWSLHTKGLLGE